MSKHIVYEPFADGVGTVIAVYSAYPTGVHYDNMVDTNASIPTDQRVPNMDAHLRINLESKELYYDYIARKSLETKVADLGSENAELKEAIAELTVMIATPQA